MPRLDRLGFGLLVALLCATSGAFAQAPPAPAPSPAPSPAPVATTPATPDYFMPDLAPAALVHDGKYVWFRPIFAAVTDYTAFMQDDASRQQVGIQENTGELRAGRIGFTLRAQGRFPIELYTTLDYQERATREKTTFQVFDLQVRVPLGPVRMTVGKQKEPISYELVGLSVMLPQQERILLPFFATRNVGVSFSGTAAHQRVTWAVGAFNDWLEMEKTFDSRATEYTGRVTALAYESANHHDYLHVGVGVRSNGTDEGQIRFSGRPESNVADRYVDSGKFAADGARELSWEALVSHGRFSVLGERFDAWADAPASGDPHFSGYYLAGSWFLTGESRPYVRAGGFAGGVRPYRRLGAVEVVGKYSHLDIDDAFIRGGLLDKWHAGINWWASMQWKVGFSYGDADLDRGGLRGNTRMFLTRVQWLY